jgi:hypothetical protein
MVITRALALWLFIVGVIWALVTAWIDLVMTGFTDRIVSFPAFLALYFSGPFVLIIGSVLVMACWHARLGTFLSLLGCAWLTWLVAPRPYLVLGIIGGLVVAAVVLFCRVAKPSNRALQPNTGCSDI